MVVIAFAGAAIAQPACATVRRVLGTLVIDGVAHPHAVTAIEGNDSFFPNQVITDQEDLTKLLVTRGRHRVSYEVDGAHSNEIVIDVQ